MQRHCQSKGVGAVRTHSQVPKKACVCAFKDKSQFHFCFFFCFLSVVLLLQLRLRAHTKFIEWNAKNRNSSEETYRLTDQIPSAPLRATADKSPTTPTPTQSLPAHSLVYWRAWQAVLMTPLLRYSFTTNEPASWCKSAECHWCHQLLFTVQCPRNLRFDSLRNPCIYFKTPPQHIYRYIGAVKSGCKISTKKLHCRNFLSEKAY